MEHAMSWKVRPKRKITKPCLDYSQMLLREEEQALKKALYVSLRDTKSEPESAVARKRNLLKRNNDSPESSNADQHIIPSKLEKRESTEKTTVPMKRKRRRKNLNEQKSRKELFQSLHNPSDNVAQRGKNVDCQDEGKLVKKIREKLKVNLTDSVLNEASKVLNNISQDNRSIDETSQDTDTERSKKCLQAQRKFAHSQPCSPNSLLIQQMGLAVPERPKTEDFIKFLCLRGTPHLPEELEYLNNPLIPSSPLSSDEDEFLPVSPFFKRQFSSPSKENNKESCAPCKFQLDENMLDGGASNSKFDSQAMKNLNGLFNDVDNKQSEDDEMSFNGQIELDENSSNGGRKEEGDADKISVEDCSLSSSAISSSRPHDGSPHKEVKSASYCLDDKRTDEKETLKSDEKETLKSDECNNKINSCPAGKKQDRKLVDLSDSSSQESSPEKKWHKKEGKNNNDSSKGRRLRKRRNKDTEPNCFEKQLNAAPIFRPMEQEFKDPVKYIKKIIPFVLKFGICVIVPPAGWQPSTNISDDLRFSTKVQHIHKMSSRNSTSSTHLKYLKRCLGEKSDLLDTVPQIGSCEVDLQEMSKVFESVGGVAKVNTPRKWQKIADSLHLPKNAQGRINKLQDIYYKYVLPFDMLSEEEKEEIKNKVDKESNEEEQDIETEKNEFKGKTNSVSVFHRIASNAQEMYAKGKTNVCLLENDFWDIVEKGIRHVAAVSGEVDTSILEPPSHTAKSKSSWNLSTLSHAQGSILKYLGVVPGLTTSVLRFSSVFSCNVWKKNEDDLFSVDYLHTGAKKIWYAVPSFFEQSFKSQQKEQSEASSLHSPLLFKCPISRTVQNEGQFVVCLPNVFHSTFSSGYSLSENCYYAPVDWLTERFCSNSQRITPSLSFPVEKIFLNFAKCELEKSKNIEPISLLVDMVKEIRRIYCESLNSLSEAGVEKVENLSQGKQRRVNSAWEECTCCNKPCFPIMVQQRRSSYCTEHAIKRLKEENIDPNSFVVKTHLDEDELENLVLNTEECLKKLRKAKDEE